MKYTILIADKNIDNKSQLENLLGQSYDYLFASNVNEVIEKFKNEQDIDLLILNTEKIDSDELRVLNYLNETNLINKLPIMLIVQYGNNALIEKAYSLGITDLILTPFNPNVVRHRVKNTIDLFNNQKKLINVVEKQIKEREETNDAMINIFSNVIELRNHESGAHTMHVQVITNLLLKELVKLTDKYKLSESDITLISSLAAMHDIGKITVPESILNKPGKLTDEEWVIMRNHTVSGYEILCNSNIDQNSKFMKYAKEIVRHHHEKFDGRGYPDHLIGDEIPISAQVVSLADCYDALTSVRCYKKAYTHDEAVAMLLNKECGEFNPILIEAFKRIESELRADLDVGLDHSLKDVSSKDLTIEVLESSNIDYDKIKLESELDNIRRKFFDDSLNNNIWIEFDNLLHKFYYLDGYKRISRVFDTFDIKNSEYNILSEIDTKRFLEKFKLVSKDNPSFELEVILNIDGRPKYHRLSCLTIWNEHNIRITTFVALTNIHEEVIKRNLRQTNISGLKELASAISTYNLESRLIDPKLNTVILVDNNGNLIDSNVKASELWNKEELDAAIIDKKNISYWRSTMRSRGKKIYAILYRIVEILNKNYILEISAEVNNHYESNKASRNHIMQALGNLDFYKDDLTCSYTRAFLTDFKENLDKSEGLILVDIENFTDINNKYSRQFGDNVLKLVSLTLLATVKKKANVVRYGGDEFVILFDHISIPDLDKISQKLEDNVKKIKFKEYPELNITIRLAKSYRKKNIEEAINYCEEELRKNKD